MYVTNHFNQEREEYIVTGHMAELMTKDQPNREDFITTYAREDVFKENGMEYIVTEHNDELFTKDQPSMGNIITTNVWKDVNKEKEHEVVMNNYTEEDRRAFLKAANDCDPSSFATLDRLGGGGYGDTQV